MKSWMQGKTDYYGLCLIAEEEEKASRKKEVQLYRSSTKPFLTITYKSFIGLEDYWSTHDQAAGSAGTGSINDYTGWLTFVHQDASSAGERMPLSISHAYNPVYGSVSDESVSPYGNHFQLSLDARLEIPAGECDVKNYPYVYTDCDGTRHYFKRNPDKPKIKYVLNGTVVETEGTGDYPAAKDEDGLDLYVVPVTNKNLKEIYPWKIVDKNGSNSMYFDKAGYLCMLRDSNLTENGKNKEQQTREPYSDYKRSLWRFGCHCKRKITT